MLTNVRWDDMSEPVDGIKPAVNCISYSPSGDHVVVSCGIRVLVYGATTGTLLHSLKGHKDTVYAVAYSSDGKRFASGGADCSVIVWSSKATGIVRYEHRDSIQAIAQNPATTQMASISNSDFGIWSTEQSKVSKHSLPSKGQCAAWSPDGQSLAIGMFDGTVIILEKGLTSKKTLNVDASVWTMAFSPIRTDGSDVLVIGSWNQRMTFYCLSDVTSPKERELDFDPCTISFPPSGEYIIAGGSDHNITLYTPDGLKLRTVVEANDWIWSAQQHPRHMQICSATNDGVISVVDIKLTPIYCIYQDQYVYRSSMTELVIHQLTLDRKMYIPCHDYIMKLATYRGRLAVQFESAIVIFELYYDEEQKMCYQDIARIRKKIDCTTMCVLTDAILTCQDKRITLHTFQGNKQREWAMESTVTFIKVIGGSDTRETILVGLKNGRIFKLFSDNPFPSSLMEIGKPIKSLDFSSSRMKLAVIDDANMLQVFDLQHKNEVMFSEPNVTAVAWSTDHEEMIAYSTTNGILHIKTGYLPAYQQKVQGFVAGFKSNHVFNLYNSVIMVLDVPYSHALHRYIEKKDFDSAYKVACLGATERDWKMLGLHALMQFNLEIARKSFTRIREVQFVELLDRLELVRHQGKGGKDQDELLLGDILAFQGKFNDAARHFLRLNNEEGAIKMYSDLKMWNEAKKICSDENHLKKLIRQQAAWAEDSQNYVEAASLYETCGDFAKAIRMMGQAGQMDKLRTLCQSLPKSEVALITECAQFFKKNNSISYALEAFERVEDNRSLINLYVDMGDWRHAFLILDRCPQFSRDVYLPWAKWLSENDKFEEALEAFRAAKSPKETVRMMETLAGNSVICRKFRDAAFYFIQLAAEYGNIDDGEKHSEADIASRIRMSNECIRKADMYYAFNSVYIHTTHPFPYNEVSLFNTAKYLLAMTNEGMIPMNIGKGEILYTLARAANRLEMIQTARSVFDKLQNVILPSTIMEQVDVETLQVRSKPHVDKEELLETCYRCKQVVAQLTAPGDRCPHCRHPFVRSFVNFEPLPLVEFVLSNDLNDEEAEAIIMASNGNALSSLAGVNIDEKADGNEKSSEGNADVVTFGEDDNIEHLIDQQMVAMGRTSASKSGNPFYAQLAYITRPGRAKDRYQPYVVNAEMLNRFRSDEIFIVKPPYGSLNAPNRYYLIMKNDVAISLCTGCQHFFSSSDYEYECMKGMGCPLCRYRPGKQIQRSMKELMLTTLEEIQNNISNNNDNTDNNIRN